MVFEAIGIKHVSQIQTHTCVFLQSMDSNDATFEVEKEVTAGTYTGGFFKDAKKECKNAENRWVFTGSISEGKLWL